MSLTGEADWTDVLSPISREGKKLIVAGANKDQYVVNWFSKAGERFFSVSFPHVVWSMTVDELLYDEIHGVHEVGSFLQEAKTSSVLNDLGKVNLMDWDMRHFRMRGHFSHEFEIVCGGDPKFVEQDDFVSARTWKGSV